MSQNKLIAQGKKFVRFLLGVPLTLAAFYFIGYFLWNSRNDIYYSITHANYILLALGLVCFFLFFFLKNIIWIKILQNLGAKDLDTSKSFFLLSFSETKRYIPGSVFAFVSRVQSFSEANIPHKLLVKSLVIESLLLMIPSMIVSIPGIFFIYPRLQAQYPEYAQYIIPGIIGIVLFSLLVICAATLLAKKKLGSEKIFSSWASYINLFFLSVLSWVFFGIGNYLVASSLHVLDTRFIAEFSSFFVLAWFVGYISIITPMGLGVREAIMILGLSPFAPFAITSLIALFSRIGFMAGEFIFLFASYILYSNKTVQKWWRYIQNHNHTVIVWSAIVSYISYFTYVSIAKYNNFFMGKFDLGNMDQTVWNTIHGRIFMFTDPDSTGTISRLAYHADFILVLLSPLYFVWSDPRVLLIVQTVVLGLGAYFVYKIALYVLKNPLLSVVLGIVYLLNPLIQKQNLYDFHAVTLATTFLLAVWYFLVTKKYWWMSLFLFLAVLTKENVYLIAALIGFFLVYKRQYKLGAVISIASLGMFLLLMKYLIPGARGGEHFAVQFLSEFGDSLGSALLAIISNPIRTIQVIFEHNGLEYLKMLLLPTGFLSILSPFYMIFAAPDITKNLLASNQNFRSSYYQYNAEILPFIFISSIYTIRLLQKKIPNLIFVYYLLFFACLGVWMYGALPFGSQPYVDIYKNPRQNTTEIREFLSSIDADKSVAATNNLGSHLSRRENIYVLPQGINDADYILFLNTDWYEPIDELNQQVENLKQDPRYKVVYQIGKFTAFERVQ